MLTAIASHCLRSYVLFGIALFGGAASAQEPATASGRTIAVPGARLYFEEHGSGAPLFLLHNFFSTGTSWRAYVPVLALHFRVIVVDMRGHGRSSNADTSIVFRLAQPARDLLALMDSLHIPRASAMGGSSGAITLLYAASMEPQRFDAITVIGAQLYTSTQVRDWIRAGFCPPDSAFVASLLQRHGPQRGTQLVRQFCHFKDLYGDLALTPDVLARITARTLVVHGDNDFVPVSQAWELFRAVPKSRLWIVPNGGHLPYTDSSNVADFTRRTLDFLQGKWK